MSTNFLPAATFADFAFAASPAVGEEVTVIELTQTACQFIESQNGTDHGFKTSGSLMGCSRVSWCS